jgi:hypothetical protein
VVSATPPCTPVAARAAILAAPALAALRPTLRSGGGPDRVLCHDFDGKPGNEMAVTVFSGGTAGDTSWAVFRREHGRWRFVHGELDVYKVGLSLAGSDLVETQPVYLKGDPNCCPTGGFEHRRFHWNGRRLVVVRRWHDENARR